MAAAKRYLVFISYSHAAEARHRPGEGPMARLKAALEAQGVSVWADSRIDPGDAWEREIRHHAHAAEIIVALVSPEACDSVWCGKEWEIGLQRQKLVPVRVAPCEPPEAIAAVQRADASQDADWFERVMAVLIERLAAGRRRASAAALVYGEMPAAPDKLIGRDDEMLALEGWWNDRLGVGLVHAIGGQGKTALARSFADKMMTARPEIRPAAIYLWSAGSQGVRDAAAATSGGFFASALKDLSDGQYTDENLPKSDRERAVRLAALLRNRDERVLVVLDGLEPLQHPTSVKDGALKDAALGQFLRLMASAGHSLALCTSRQPLPELRAQLEGGLAAERALNDLSEAGGAALLKHFGVNGRPQDMRAAVAAVKGHALSLRLLGGFLTDFHGGKVEHYSRFDFARPVDPSRAGDAAATRAEAIVEGYLAKLDEMAAAGRDVGAERAVLNCIGLFDRPVDGAAFRALMAEPAIVGLTDALFRTRATAAEPERPILEAERAQRLSAAVDRLVKLGLVTKPEGEDGALDAHPIIRGYFDRRLRAQSEAAWRAAHDRLFEHYRSSAASEELPDTRDGMLPLLYAVGHGAKAGRVREALDAVYRRRMDRGRAYYLTRALGAYDLDLAALTAFFAPGPPGAPIWAAPSDDLPEPDRGFVVSSVGFALSALGRLGEAAAPFEAGEKLALALRDPENASAAALNLTEVLFALGDLGGAAEAAARALEHAEAAENDSHRVFSLSYQAPVAHALGERAAALALFERAEALWATCGAVKRLWSSMGAQFADLLIDLGRAEEALERAEEIEALHRRFKPSALDAALLSWTFGRALAPEPERWPEPAAGAPERVAAAAARLDEAIDRFDAASRDDYTPRGFLARAGFRRWRLHCGDAEAAALAEGAGHDLDAAAGLADFSGMRLHQADIALERARLALAMRSRGLGAPDVLLATAAEHMSTAERLINATGYRRRDAALTAVQRALKAL